jgi:hypothetical protein
MRSWVFHNANLELEEDVLLRGRECTMARQVIIIITYIKAG